MLVQVCRGVGEVLNVYIINDFKEVNMCLKKVYLISKKIILYGLIMTNMVV